jgi:AcrR family transcriptional regulator
MQKQRSSENRSSVLSLPTPIRRPPGSQRRRIIDAMIASCGEKTFLATTIGDLVSRASISRTTFYRCFPDKRACFDAALDDCIEKLSDLARDSALGAGSPAEAVRSASSAVLRHLSEQPAVAQLLTTEAVSVDAEVTGRYRHLVVPALSRLWGIPRDRLHSSPGLAFGRAQLLILNEVAAGHPERIPALQPEIVYLAVAPFAGHDEALREARAAADDAAIEPWPR